MTEAGLYSGTRMGLNLYKKRRFTGLLDIYPNAAVAYSLRQLKTGVTNVVRVRRSSDNAESDFTALQITDGTLLTWVGAGNNGFITRWYEQNTGTNHAVQIVAGSQAQIVNAGTLRTRNGKPSAYFDGGDFYEFTSFSAVTDWSAFTISQRDATNRIDATFAPPAGTIGASTAGLFTDGNVYINRIAGAQRAYRTAADNTATFNILESYNIGNVLSAYKNNVGYVLTAELLTTYNNTNFGCLGRFVTNHMTGHISEAILYTSDKSGDRAGILTNINNHYSIY